MPTDRENICCQEIPMMKNKLYCLVEEDGLSQDAIPKCITEHRGFGQNCTAEYSLQTAYYSYEKKDKKKRKIEE